MKKVLSIILAAALLAGCAAAFAEETAAAEAAAGETAAESYPLPGLFDLYDVNGESAAWLGVGVPVSENVLITAGSVIPETVTQLVITDGVNVWSDVPVYRDDGRLSALIVLDTSTVKPAIGPFETADTVLNLVPAACSVRSADVNQSRINRSVTSLVPMVYNTYDALLADMSGDAVPGSALLDANGDLAGIAVADYAEGNHRMVFLSVDGILQCMYEASRQEQNTVRQALAPEGFTVTADANTLTFDWSAMALPECGEGEQLFLVVADTNNNYLTYYGISDQETSCSMLLTPGRTYISGITPGADKPDLPERFVITELPEAEPLEDYGFTPVRCAVAELPQSSLGAGTPVDEVTEELLRSGRAAFYSASAYQVDRQIDNVTLLVSLTDPDGNNYRYASSWIYDPACMANDTWSVPFEETGLLDMLNANGYPKGVYLLTYYIGGKLADVYTFELK